VAIAEVAMFTVRDGRIAEHWVYPDVLSTQRQSGLMPGADGTSA
jgi:ketosteroid isomerase-like protein